MLLHILHHNNFVVRTLRQFSILQLAVLIYLDLEYACKAVALVGCSTLEYCYLQLILLFIVELHWSKMKFNVC